MTLVQIHVAVDLEERDKLIKVGAVTKTALAEMARQGINLWLEKHNVRIASTGELVQLRTNRSPGRPLKEAVR